MTDVWESSPLTTEVWVSATTPGVELRVVVKEGVDSGGTNDHRLLSNRDAADQHPIGAVTGLDAALLAKADVLDIPDIGPLADAVDAIGGRNAPGGYPGLDGSGLIAENKIPASIARDTEVAAGLASKVDTTDPRLTDSRTPTAHKASHATGGTDALTPADIGAADASALASKADLVGGFVVPSQLASGARDDGKVPTLTGGALEYKAPTAGGSVFARHVIPDHPTRYSESTSFVGTQLTGLPSAVNCNIAPGRLQIGVGSLHPATLTKVCVTVKTPCTNPGALGDLVCWSTAPGGIPSLFVWSTPFPVDVANEIVVSGLSLPIASTGKWAFGVYSRPDNTGNLALAGADSGLSIDVDVPANATLGTKSWYVRPSPPTIPTDFSSWIIRAGSDLGNKLMLVNGQTSPLVLARSVP